MESTLEVLPHSTRPGSPLEPGRRELGRFRLGGLLGQGGMGQVYEAFDPHLSRTVAVKVLSRQGAVSLRRFIREARSQARLAHEDICPVFEAGEVEGRPYIVMQRIHGRPLDEELEEASLEEKLGVLRRVAEAVHEAHRNGLIHRDLKPGNILVERREDGSLKPYVLDFGLARRVAGEGDLEDGLTADGSALGTPAFMAPEQLRGKTELLDRRTDVYALGATLYRLLAGHGPFRGTGLELLRAALDTEPEPLTAEQAPADVAAIVFKCLEKDSARRYGSARALAEDLQRYLDGEPVQARPAGRWYRFRKALRRNLPLVVVSAVAMLLLLAALGWGLATSLRAEARQQLTRRFTEKVEEAEALARYSHLSPLHDVRPDRRLLLSKMEEIRQLMDRAGEPGRGAGLYALGRGFLTLEDLASARKYLDEAWASGYREAEVAAARAQVLSALYRERLASVDLLEDWEARRRLQQELDESLGTPARILLEAAPPDGGEDGVILQALAAFHGERFAEALRILESARQRHLWRYELDELDGDVRRAWAARLFGEGDVERARLELEGAAEAYRRAAEVAQSDPSVHRAAAESAALRLAHEVLQGEDLSGVFESGKASIERALAADPEDPRSLLWKSRLYRLMAQSLRTRAEDPSTHLEVAGEAARRAAEVLPEPSEALRELARVLWGKAQWQRVRGEDPGPEIEAAVTALQAVALPWRDFIYFNTLGMAYMTLGDYQETRGLGAGPSLDLAIDAYRQAVERHSMPFAALSNLGACLVKKSELEEVARPVPVLEEAVAVLLRARNLRPGHVAPHFYLGRAYLRLAQGGNGASGLLDDRVDLAIRSYETALAANPAMAQLHNALGEARHLEALAAWDRGQDPEPFFRMARSSYAEGLARAPEDAFLLQNLAWTAYFQAKFRVREGRSPEPFLEEAIHRARGADGRASQPGAILCLASAYRIEAEYAVRRGLDPTSALARAGKELQRLLELNPRHAEAHRSLARLETLEGGWRASRGEPAEKALADARRALERALELAPDVASFWLADARWALVAGRSQGGNAAAREVLMQGRASAERALALRPFWAEAEALRGALGMAAEGGAGSGSEGARAELEAALAANPHLRGEWGPLLRVPRR